MSGERIAIFGGVYSNHLALRALIDDVRRRGIERMFCLGDLGAFGPNPDKVFPLLHEAGIQVVQGNYDHSLGNGMPDCQCGYTDASDNYFARLSYDYTFRRTSGTNKAWMKSLPTEIRLKLGGVKVLLCHGSPRQTNEFLWETTTSTAFLDRLCREHDADVIVGTHTGLRWHRRIGERRHFVNCGVIGRPANDGATNVWYTVLTTKSDNESEVDFVAIEYDYKRLAAEMRDERLPVEFIQTIETGWWTTCLEVLPMKERLRGRF